MTEFGVIWSRYDDKFQIEIGQLLYDGTWSFAYDTEGLEVALKLGFQPFIEFSDVDKVYTSDKLFETFETRINNNLVRQLPLKNEEDKIDRIYKTKAIMETDNIFLEAKEREYDMQKRR